MFKETVTRPLSGPIPLFKALRSPGVAKCGAAEAERDACK